MIRRPPTRVAPDEPREDTPVWSSLNDALGPRLDGDPTGAQPDARPEKWRFGRYELLAELGRGGMGVVYRAWDPSLRREVALKVMAGGLARDGAARQRFLREARAAAALDHPNTIRLLDIAEAHDALFFTMPVLSGPTLSERLRQGGPLAPDEAARIAADLAGALGEAHKRGVAHRDVKPGNVIFDNGKPVLTDFGLVKQLDGETEPLTRESSVLGTAAYLAPELLSGGPASAGPASDQYALGALIYQCLSGALPYPGNTPMDVANRMLAGAPPRLERLGVPGGLARIAHRALAEAPQDRFEDLAAMEAALRAWADEGASPSWSRDQLGRIRQRLRRPGRALAVGLALAVLAIGALTAAVGARLLRERAAERRRVELEADLSRLAREGDLEQAAARFSAFAHFEDNRGTPALARAWMTRGEALLARGLLTEAQSALSAAFVLSRDEDDQSRALLGLASVQARLERWPQLAALVETLEARGVAGADAQRTASLAAGRRLTAAAAGASGALRPVLRALSQATPLGRSAIDAAIFPSVPPELLLYDAGTGLLSRSTLSRVPQERARARVADGWTVRRRIRVLPGDRGDEPLLLTADETRCQVQRWSEQGLEALGGWPCSTPAAVAAADLDGDGSLERFATDESRLLALSRDPDSGRWGASDAHPHTSSARSILRELRAFPTDAGEALAVASGGWGAYDVRVLRQTDEGLTLVGRDRLGSVTALTALRQQGETLLAAFQELYDDALWDVHAFGPQAPHGEGRGIHLLAWTPTGLERRGLLPLAPYAPDMGDDVTPGLKYDKFVLEAADLDGDGDQELLFGYGWSRLRVFAREADGGWSSVALEGLFPLLVTDVDGDGDEEVLVRDTTRGDALWWLGAGDGALPALAPALPEIQEPPDGLHPLDEAPWSRAERLAAVGLVDEAATRLAELAEQRAGSVTEGLAWRRVAELRASLGAHSAAAEAWTHAAALEALAAEAWESAAREYTADLRHEDALRALEARVALGDPPASVRAAKQDLSTLLAAPAQTLSFSDGLPPGWAARAPLALRRELGAAGLRVRLTAGEEALRVRVRRTSARVRIALTMCIRRLEPALGVALGFPARRDGVVASWVSYGGGGVYSWGTSVRDTSGPVALWGLDPAQVTAAPSWTLVYEHVEGDPQASIARLRGEQEVDRRLVAPAALPGLGEALDLSLYADGVRTSTGDFILTGVNLSGLEVDTGPLSPVDQAHGLLLQGRVAEAETRLDALGATGPDADLIRALIAEDLGQTTRAKQALRRALAASPELGGHLIGLLRLHAPRLIGPLQEILGAKILSAVAGAFGEEPDSPDEGEDARLLSLLGSLDPLGACCLPAQEAAQLWLRRAAIYRRMGSVAKAEADLDRALGRAAGLDGRSLSAIEVEQARLMAETGRPQQAIAALVSALDAHPSPEVLADRLSIAPDLAPLRSAEGWATIEAARRLGDAQAPTRAAQRP